MALYTKLVRVLKPLDGLCIIRSAHSATDQTPADDEFRVFDLRGNKAKKEAFQGRFVRPPPPPPREKVMPTDQDWPSVWPGQRTFHPAVVPLPLRQGHDKKRKIPPPGKYANAELMKLPNYLHLTPPAVKRHCEAIKKFCTPWPKGLETEEQIEKHFPLEIMTSDYCYSSPKIRDPKARVVTFKFSLSRLALDDHAKDKMKRLLGDRWNPETDEVTLVTDRCPLRKQNHDYNMYLLYALFYESLTIEPWEAEKCEEDMEYYDWERNKSKKAYLALKYWPKQLTEDEMNEISLEGDELAEEYKNAVTDLIYQGETIGNLFKYKEAVMKIAL